MLRGVLPVSFPRYSDPFQSPRSLIVGPFYCSSTTSSRPIPHDPARSNLLTPAESDCVQLDLHAVGQSHFTPLGQLRSKMPRDLPAQM